MWKLIPALGVPRNWDHNLQNQNRDKDTSTNMSTYLHDSSFHYMSSLV
jgi:hypothetical protein